MLVEYLIDRKMIGVLILFLTSCGLLEATEVCYEPCGCFSDDPPFDHLPLPEPPASVGIENRLFTRSNPLNFDPISIDSVSSFYMPSKRTMYLIHGYTESGENWDDVKDMILQNFDFNVIVVHWNEGANNLNYLLSASNTRLVGACTGALINHLVTVENAPMSNQYCVGLSLGGQACSFVGKSLNGVLPRITALDPAGPAFEKNDTRTRLDKTDAVLVDTIHTNGDEGLHFGMGYAVSDIDFYPNNGTSPQPPCPGGLCSHVVSRRYYLVSLNTTLGCDFTAYPCESHIDAGAGLCDTCMPGFDCQRMGYFAETEPGRGTYYLTTGADHPYCETQTPPIKS